MRVIFAACAMCAAFGSSVGRPAVAAERPRPPVVAGTFYPGDPDRLRAAIDAFLETAVPARPERPLVLVAPHAGYVYSGQIMADAWRQAAGGDYDVVVILGVNHRAAGFRGISVYTGAGYATPLGTARCDRDLARRLADSDERFRYTAAADRDEHSVEVQVPFAQTVLPGVPILPVVIGGDDHALWTRFARTLARELDGRRPLIVASSDLAHYPPHDEACASDRAVLEAVAGLDPERVGSTIDRIMGEHIPGLATCACGEGPILIGLEAVRLLGATRACVLSHATSGDASVGDRDRCVGYGAVAVTVGAGPSDITALDAPAAPAGDVPLTPADREDLLDFARRTLAQYLTSDTTPLFRGGSPAVRQHRGVFVTLHQEGRLRGCIGHMVGDLPLGQAVGRMALQAAFQDPRFEPVRADELPRLEIEISVLTPARPVPGPDAVVPGRDGVVLQKDGRSAVFLPQVATEQGWDRDTLLTRLALKAGLPGDAWRDGAQLSTFRAIVFGEHEAPDR